MDQELADLVARRKYDKAIRLLRSQLEGRWAPGPRLRLELAEVLTFAGRGSEAVPILLGLADEFAADGFVAKAVASLKRVERIEPGRADVAARLQALVRQQQTAGVRELAPPVRAEADAPLEEPAVEQALEEAVVDDEPEPGPVDVEARQRMRGAFQRFLESLPPEPPADEADESSVVDEILLETALDAPTEIPAEAIVLDAEGAPTPLSEEDFEIQVFDLIEGVIELPAAPERLLGEAPCVASRLVASPLFADLSEQELLAVVRELTLLGFEPGDIVVTEGEPGDSLFILTGGEAKVFVRNPEGRNFVVGRLAEGDFFGEISSLSGRPRTATVTAATRCELLALAKPALDALARAHPRVREAVEAHYLRRAGSPEAAAVRAAPPGDAPARERAGDILIAHFGERRWDPRMRLHLAQALLDAGHDEDAVTILAGLADDLARRSLPEKAIAILKKVERIRRRHIEELRLAPRKPTPAQQAPAAAAPSPAPRAPAPETPRARSKTAVFFEQWLVDLARDALRRRLARGLPTPPGDAAPDSAPAAAYGRGLRASPLFRDFSEDELLALIQGLRLLTFEAGDVILTEGEPGEGVFILATGSVRVFARDAAGRNVALAELDEGCFFGEISTLSGRPRSATIVASSHCELLELDKATLETISATHPRVREVLEEFSLARTTDLKAAAIRARPPAQ